MAVVNPIAVEFRLTGGINGVTNTNPFLSLGGQMATKVLDDKIDNLFDPVSGLEAVQGTVEYRWIVCWNTSNEPIKQPRFYFLPKDPNVDIEISRLAVSAPVTILPTEEDRPIEEEIGPEVDVPMPFTKSTEDYETTLSKGPDIPGGGKLYICVRRVIPEDSPNENRAFRLICESRIPIQASATGSEPGEVEGELNEVSSATSGYWTEAGSAARSAS
jgi:hypothetical protein